MNRVATFFRPVCSQKQNTALTQLSCITCVVSSGRSHAPVRRHASSRSVSLLAGDQSEYAPFFQYKSREVASVGDMATLLLSDGKRICVRLVEGKKFDTHLGQIDCNLIIGCKWGSEVVGRSRVPTRTLVTQSTLSELLQQLKRVTQVVYLKDYSYLIHKLGIHSGTRVLECCTGSGHLTSALAATVYPSGQIYTVEGRASHLATAKKNLSWLGLQSVVHSTMHQLSATTDYESPEIVFNAAWEPCDTAVIDVRDPFTVLPFVKSCLTPGSPFVCILPTTNQVSSLLSYLNAENGFVDVSVDEVLVRSYQPLAERLRPTDRMIGHTCYLVFARTYSADSVLDTLHWTHPLLRYYRQKQQQSPSRHHHDQQEEDDNIENEKGDVDVDGDGEEIPPHSSSV